MKTVTRQIYKKLHCYLEISQCVMNCLYLCSNMSRVQLAIVLGPQTSLRDMNLNLTKDNFCYHRREDSHSSTFSNWHLLKASLVYGTEMEEM